MTTSGASKVLAGILGANLRSARVASGLTQREVALRLSWRKTDAQAVSDWERGVRRPSDEALLLIAEMFDRDVAWFYTSHERVAA